MRFSIIILLLSFFNSFAQNMDSIELSCDITFSPSFHYTKENYQLKYEKTTHIYEKGVWKFSPDNKKDKPPKRKRKNKKTKTNDILNYCRIIQEVIEKDTVSIFIPNLEIVTRLKEKFPNMEKIIKQKFFFSFKEYQIKFDSLSEEGAKTLNSFYFKTCLGGDQITRNLISFYLKKNSETIIDYYIREPNMPIEVEGMKIWLSFYRLTNNTKAFTKSKLKRFFTKDKLEKFIIEYLSIISK